MAKTGKFDDLGPIYMVQEHYDTFKDIIKKYDQNNILLEIGSLKGRSAIEILTNNKNITLNCLDKWTKHSINEFEKNIKKYNVSERIKKIRDKSANVRKYFADFTVDFIYLDACHKYEFVLHDLKLCHHILKPNGILLGDDMHLDGVKNAVNKSLEKGMYKKIWIKEYLFLLKPNYIKFL